MRQSSSLNVSIGHTFCSHHAAKKGKGISMESLLTCKQLSEAIGMSQSSIRKATTREFDTMPHLRMPAGKAVRYRLSDVVAWMETSQVA